MINDIRLENLQRVIDEHFNGVKRKLALAMGVQAAQISRVFSENPATRKALGDSMSRAVERAAGLPEGWLDNPHDDSNEDIIARLNLLDERDRQTVESLIDSLIERQSDR